MRPRLSLPAYLAIARMVARAAPFDADIARLVVEELQRELPSGADRADDDVEAGRTPAIRTGTAPADNRRSLDAVIAEIDGRIGAAAMAGGRLARAAASREGGA